MSDHQEIAYIYEECGRRGNQTVKRYNLKKMDWLKFKSRLDDITNSPSPNLFN